MVLLDIDMMFSAHDQFRGSTLDKDSLGRICKVYAEYDEEIGHSENLPFLAASLLMQVCRIYGKT